MSEKRTDPRFGPLVIKARVDTAEESREGYLTNISRGGAFLALDDPPAIGTVVALRVILPWRLGELRSEARVVWRNDPQRTRSPKLSISGVGLQFTGLEKGSADKLEAYLERFVELAASIDDSA